MLAGSMFDDELTRFLPALVLPVSQNPTATLTSPVDGGPSAACWDPHHARVVASADGRHLRCWDLRAGNTPTATIANAHEDLVKDVDFNPNKPFHLLSCGADRRVRLWDLRKPGEALKTLCSHSHWLWQSRFNQFHDQLILSAGTERVNLWNIISLSSAPIGELEASGSQAGGSVRQWEREEACE
jgi:WD40 repeat protein